MSRRKEVYVLFAIAIILILFSNHANAQENRKGKWGAGIGVNAVNFSIGPLAKYWITDNIGTQVIYSAAGGF